MRPFCRGCVWQDIEAPEKVGYVLFCLVSALQSNNLGEYVECVLHRLLYSVKLC